MIKPTTTSNNKRPLGCAFLFLIAGLIVPVILPKIRENSASGWTKRDRSDWPANLEALAQSWELSAADLRTFEVYSRGESYVCGLKATRRTLDGLRATWVPIELLPPTTERTALENSQLAVRSLFAKTPRRWKRQGPANDVEYFANRDWDLTVKTRDNYVASYDPQSKWIVVWCQGREPETPPNVTVDKRQADRP